MMKPYIVALALLLPISLYAASSKVEVGQTQQQATEALGKPQGEINLPDKTLLLYPEGEITIHEGVVSKIDLMSDQQFAQDQERQKREHEEWVIQQEKLEADRIAAGEKLKAYKLQNSTFAALPAKDRVEYWRSFQAKFPQVDVSEEIARALESYQAEIAELKNQQRIAELEVEVAQAQKKAEEARLETAKLREETEARNDASNFRLREYYSPQPYFYHTPRIIIHSRNYQNKGIIEHYNPDRWNYNNYKLPQQRSNTTIQNATQFMRN